MAQLDNLDSGNFATINASVAFNDTNVIGIDNLSTYFTVDGYTMPEPENFFYQYLGVLKGYTETVTIPSEFLYNPKALSKSLYGTTDLDYLILLLNGIASARDFTNTSVIVFSPTSIPFLVQLIQDASSKYLASKASPEVIVNE